MALSYNAYTANGSQNTYSTPPYLDETHLEVFLNGVEQSSSTYTITGTSLVFNDTPAYGSTVRVGRNSNRSARLTDYADASLLTADAMDFDSNQLFYIAQEALDKASETNIGSNTFYSSSSTAPENPKIGDLWYDVGSKYLKIYNGTEWVLAVPTNDTLKYENFISTEANYSYIEVSAVHKEALVFLNGVKLVEASQKGHVLPTHPPEPDDYYIDVENERIYFAPLTDDNIVEVVLAVGAHGGGSGDGGSTGDGLSVVDNSDGTFTFTNTNDGTAIIISDGNDGAAAPIPTVTDNGDGSYTIDNGDGDVVTFSDGGDGVDGVTPVRNVDYFDGSDGSFVSFIYKVNASLPSTPTGGSFDGTVEAQPSGWSDDPTADTTDIEWVSKTRYTHDVATDTWTNDGWSTPSYFFQRGTDGPDGTDGTDGNNGTDGTDGTDGVDGDTPQFGFDYFNGNDGSFVSFIYKDSISKPSTPTGGTFNGNSETFPSGSWYDVPTETTADIEWISTTKYTHNSTTDTWTNNGWSQPRMFFQRGQDGADGTSVTIKGSFSTTDGLATLSVTPTLGDGYIIGGDLYVCINLVTPINANNFQNVGAIAGNDGNNGTDGTDGTNGINNYIHFAYADDNQGNGFSKTDADGKSWLGIYVDQALEDSATWSHYTWQLIKGADGETITWKGDDLTSHPANPENGWAYYNPDLGRSYIYKDNAWFLMTKDGKTPLHGVDYFDGGFVSFIYKVAETLPINYGPEKITNGTFDSNLSDWTGDYIPSGYSELLTNGNFDSDLSGFHDGRSAYEWVDGKAVKKASHLGETRGLYSQDVALEEGATYEITGDFTHTVGSPSNGRLAYIYGIDTGDTDGFLGGYITSSGSFSHTFTVSNVESNPRITFWIYGNVLGSWDNLSIKRVATVDTSIDTYFQQSSGKIERFYGDDTAGILQTFSTSIGKDYEVNYTINQTDGATGTLLKLNNQTVLNKDGDGSFTHTFKATTTSTQVGLYTEGNFRGTIDNVSVKEVGSIAPIGGTFDGTTEVQPSGWTDNPTANPDDTEWVSKTKYIQIGENSWQHSGWSTPSIFYQKGADGLHGVDGMVYKGASTLPPSNPKLNWAYRDTDDGIIYIYNGNAWEKMVYDGDEGPAGAPGGDGLSVFITYTDAKLFVQSPLATSDGNVTINGITWSTTPTANTRYMSQKVAASATEGTWSAPIKIRGANGFAGAAGPAGSGRFSGNYNSNITQKYWTDAQAVAVILADAQRAPTLGDVVSLSQWNDRSNETSKMYNGSDTWGDVKLHLNGSLIVEGSISADAIATDAIKAEHIKSAQIKAGHINTDAIRSYHILANAIKAEHIEAGALVVGTASVDTLHIKGNAVTLPVVATRAQASIINGIDVNYSYEAYISDVAGGSILVTATAWGHASDNDGRIKVQLQEQLGSGNYNVVREYIAGVRVDNGADATWELPIILSYLKKNLSTTAKYRMRFERVSGDIEISNTQVVAMGVKR